MRDGKYWFENAPEFAAELFLFLGLI